MATTREVTAAKASRLQRAKRFFTPDKLGSVCQRKGCGLRLPLKYEALGFATHATCGPEMRDLARAGLTA